ncbi:LacI family DNA-binding transcriptional regulator [Kineococcus rhizosphaerae]|uniref:DNA-binding LacI/PurR family transcriptional regulator n=1 Tax=Kineococcus rhizosphaerae TaxID=559628 RepID=A0A2T0QZ96_9ACTN|nr:LacI family DNA-binding transcriptional regulator [Kineococcus rhizosphaerae]PRY11824.1 DNA-binding LacI/PurR family transcriptional regulator [Kineococcus rhizosphaerae]
MTRPATIVDVARVAGVSRQTVTRAMHDMAGISPATRDRVLAAARELNYHPSRFGRGLVKPAARTLGLLVGDLTNPYYAELASTVLRLAGERGWNVVMAEPGSVADLTGGADAVIGFTGLALDPPATGAPNLPVVEIDPPRVQPGHGRVEFERATATRDAVRHLLSRGVRRPVVLDRAGTSARGRAFAEAFRAEGVEPVPADRELGWPDLAGAAPDALVAFNDLDGFRLLRDLASAGVAVPGEVKVVGVDGLAVGEFVTPRLSTLAIDLTEVAGAALDLVVELSQGRSEAAVRVVAHRFVARDST